MSIMKYAFGGATSFNGDVEQWNVENVGNFERMFEDASSFERNISVSVSYTHLTLPTTPYV